MTALAVEDVSKNFGGVAALSGVSLTIAQGERRVLLGPNGAGKTTLFHTISGNVAPSAGRIVLFDTDITRLRPDRRARLGLARTFQITNLFPRLTVLDSVLLALDGAAGRGMRFLGSPSGRSRHGRAGAPAARALGPGRGGAAHRAHPVLWRATPA